MTDDELDFGKRKTVLLALVPIAGIPIAAIGCDAHSAHIGICLYECQYADRNRQVPSRLMRSSRSTSQARYAFIAAAVSPLRS